MLIPRLSDSDCNRVLLNRELRRMCLQTLDFFLVIATIRSAGGKN